MPKDKNLITSANKVVLTIYFYTNLVFQPFGNNICWIDIKI